MYYVYLLQNQERGWYIGYTGDLRRRLAEHQSGQNQSTAHGDYHLIYYEAYLEKMDAIGRERFLKSGSGRKFLKKQLQYFLYESRTNQLAGQRTRLEQTLRAAD